MLARGAARSKAERLFKQACGVIALHAGMYFFQFLCVAAYFPLQEACWSTRSTQHGSL